MALSSSKTTQSALAFRLEAKQQNAGAGAGLPQPAGKAKGTSRRTSAHGLEPDLKRARNAAGAPAAPKQGEHRLCTADADPSEKMKSRAQAMLSNVLQVPTPLISSTLSSHAAITAEKGDDPSMNQQMSAQAHAAAEEPQVATDLGTQPDEGSQASDGPAMQDCSREVALAPSIGKVPEDTTIHHARISSEFNRAGDCSAAPKPLPDHGVSEAADDAMQGTSHGIEGFSKPRVPNKSNVAAAKSIGKSMPQNPERALHDAFAQLGGYTKLGGVGAVLSEFYKAPPNQLMDIFRQRSHQWLASLASAEKLLAEEYKTAVNNAKLSDPKEALKHAQEVSSSFINAVHCVVDGVLQGAAATCTLAEELEEFCNVAASGCSPSGEGFLAQGRTLSVEDASVVASSVWGDFGSARDYTEFLTAPTGINLGVAGLGLSGGAAWQRLMCELECAVRLARPTRGAAGKFGQNLPYHGVWEDNAARDVMLHRAFGSLQQRARYVASRVEWTLQQLGVSAASYMEDAAMKGRSSAFQKRCARILSVSALRSLVSDAVAIASKNTAQDLLHMLEETIWAGCLRPQVLILPNTQPDFELLAPVEDPEAAKKVVATPCSGKERVRREMQLRGSLAGTVPGPLLALESGFLRSFDALRKLMVTQTAAFAGAALQTFCRKGLDEAFANLDVTSAQRQLLAMEHAEAQVAVQRAEARLQEMRGAVTALRALLAGVSL